MRRAAHAAAVAWWTVIAVAVPAAVLLRLVGPPLPRRLVALAVAGPIEASHQQVLACVAFASWLTWAVVVTAVVARIGGGLVRGLGRLPRLRLPSPLRGLSAAMLGTVTVTTVASPAAAHVAATAGLGLQHPHDATPPVGTAPGAIRAAVAVTEHARITPPNGIPATVATAELPKPPAVSRTTAVAIKVGDRHYTAAVHHGDTLWHIAGAWLGNPLRWPEIYQLNQSHYDQRGRMRGGNHIEPGWVLVLPNDATPPPGAQPRDPPHQVPGTSNQPTPPPASGQASAPTPSTGGTPLATPSSPSPAPSTTASSPAVGGSASASADPDGVDPMPRVGSASPSPTPTSPAPSHSSPAPTRSPAPASSHPHGIALPSGSWVDLGLATAVVAAVALVWAQRRRRYTRRPPSPELRLSGPDVAPMPPVVNQIRRRLRQASEVAGDTADGAGLDLFTDPDDPIDNDSLPQLEHQIDTDPGPAGDRDAPDAAEPVDGDAPGDPDEDGLDGADDEDPPAQPPSHDRSDQWTPGLARPVVPSLSHPLSVAWPPAGLGLTGPGAEAAARGFLTGGLAVGGVDEPDARTWVVMPSATAATLLGAHAVAIADTPRLTVTAGLDEALDLLEAQTLHRSRLVYAHEVDTVAQLRAADPTEQPLPPILLLADATTRHQRTRIAALLAQGQRLDIQGVLLGAWPDGDTVVVAADGATCRADGEGSRHGGHLGDIGRLTVLTPADTSDLLATLAESHTRAPQAAAPVEPTVAIPGTHLARPLGHDAHPQSAAPDPAAHPAAGTDAVSPISTQPVVAGAVPGTREDAEPSATGPQPTAAGTEPGSVDRTRDTASTAAQGPPPGDAPAASGTDVDDSVDDMADHGEDRVGPGRVQVTVLGPAGILDVPPGPTPRKKSLEVLVYLAVHDGQATAEAILDDLMPDVPASKAPGRLYTYVSDLRTTMRRTGGSGTYVTHPNQRYALNHHTVQVDLWRMRDAIRDAEHATDPAQRIAALRRAVDTYAGHLAEGADYEWIEPYRQAVRQQALDASLALVDALSGNPAEQITVLDTAIRHNPYVEELYQQAMRARAALGHLDAIRTLRRTLTRKLAEIGAEPTDETIAMAEQLVAGLQRPARRPDLRPAPRPGDGAAAA